MSLSGTGRVTAAVEVNAQKSTSILDSACAPQAKISKVYQFSMALCLSMALCSLYIQLFSTFLFTFEYFFLVILSAAVSIIQKLIQKTLCP